MCIIIIALILTLQSKFGEKKIHDSWLLNPSKTEKVFFFRKEISSDNLRAFGYTSMVATGGALAAMKRNLI